MKKGGEDKYLLPRSRVLKAAHTDTGTQPVEDIPPAPAPEHDAPATAHVEPVVGSPIAAAVAETVPSTPVTHEVPIVGGCSATQEA